MNIRSSASAPLILFEWNGEAFVPLPRFARLCDKDFVIGERYRMEVVEDRSHRSHSHYFAALQEAWQNLPEGTAAQFPTVESLRKYALIKAGYCDLRTLVCGSNAEARKVAAFVKPMDEFAVVIAEGPIVTVCTAKSQSHRAMDKQTFQASKTAVLEVVSAMIGVKSDDLEKQRERV